MLGWIAPATCVEIRVRLSDEQRMIYATAEPEERHRIAATAINKLWVLERLIERHGDDRILIIGQFLDQLQAAAPAFGIHMPQGEDLLELVEH